MRRLIAAGAATLAQMAIAMATPEVAPHPSGPREKDRSGARRKHVSLDPDWRREIICNPHIVIPPRPRKRRPGVKPRLFKGHRP